MSYHHVIQTQASKTAIKTLLHNLGNVNLPAVHWKGTLSYKGREKEQTNALLFGQHTSPQNRLTATIFQSQHFTEFYS